MNGKDVLFAEDGRIKKNRAKYYRHVHQPTVRGMLEEYEQALADCSALPACEMDEAIEKVRAEWAEKFELKEER